MTAGTAIMYGVAGVAIAAGLLLLIRLRLDSLRPPARTASLIGGVMVLMFGLFLAIFATVAWQDGAASPYSPSAPE